MKNMKLVVAMLLAALMLVGCGQTQKPADSGEVKKEEFLINMDIAYMKATLGDKTLALEKKEDTWYIVGDEKTVISQTKANVMAELLSTISHSQEVEREQSLDEYGLVNPTITVLVKDAEGNSANVYVGKKAESGGYYVAVNDKAYVYVVDSNVVLCIQTDAVEIQTEENDPMRQSMLLEQQNASQNNDSGETNSDEGTLVEDVPDTDDTLANDDKDEEPKTEEEEE